MRGKKARALRKQVREKGLLEVKHKRKVLATEILITDGKKEVIPAETMIVLDDCERKKYKELKRAV